MSEIYQPTDNTINQLASLIDKNVPTQAPAIATYIKNKISESREPDAFSQEDIEFLINPTRLGIISQLRMVGVSDAFRKVYVLSSADVEQLAPASATKHIWVFHHTLGFSLTQTAKIISTMSADALKIYARQDLKKIGKLLQTLQYNTQNIVGLEFIQEKTITTLTPAHNVISKLMTGLLSRGRSVEDTRKSIRMFVDKNRKCDADLNYLEYSYIWENVDCFMWHLTPIQEASYMFEASRLIALDVLITQLHFSPAKAIDTVYNNICMDSCELTSVPEIKLNTVKNAMVSFIEQNPALDVFTAQNILTAVTRNMSVASSYRLGNVPSLLAANQVEPMHMALLEPNKLNATQILYTNFDFKVKEAFNSINNFHHTEILSLIKTMPVIKIEMLKGYLAELMISGPKINCTTIEEALGDAIDLSSAKKEVTHSSHWFESNYVSSLNYVFGTGIEDWHIEKMLSQSVQDDLNEQALVAMEYRNLNSSTNVMRINAVHNDMTTWNLLTQDFKFHCIDAKARFFAYSPAQKQELPAMARDKILYFYEMLKGEMYNNYVLTTQRDDSSYNSALKAAVAYFTLSFGKNFHHLNISDLLAPKAALDLLREVQNEKTAETVSLHFHMQRQDEFQVSMVSALRTVNSMNVMEITRFSPLDMVSNDVYSIAEKYGDNNSIEWLQYMLTMFAVIAICATIGNYLKLHRPLVRACSRFSLFGSNQQNNQSARLELIYEDGEVQALGDDLEVQKPSSYSRSHNA